MTKKNLDASVDIDASPDSVWSVISDLKRMPEWSPQCRWMRVLGTLREGAYTINMNRQGHKFWPTASKVDRYEPGRAIAFRTLTNDSVWLFEITATETGSKLIERRLVPQDGTSWFSKTIVAHILGGEDSFDDEMLDGMKTTLAKIKAAVEHRTHVSGSVQ
ncbi:SRPBCC family protein [Mycobacterium sp. MMS18-G62]